METINVAAGLIFRAGRLLITQRRDGDHMGGLWEFPGGKRENGESFEACLRRELKEELGIEVAVREMIEEITHAYPDRLIRLRFFRCELARGEPELHGCQALAWVGPDELDHYAFPAADARLLERLKKTTALWQQG